MKRKFTSVLLVLVLLLSLTSCGKSDKDALFGTWEGDFELADALNVVLKDELGPEIADYFQLSSFPVKIRLVFNSDETYVMILDEATMPQTMKSFKQDLRDSIVRYMEALIAMEGYDTSVEEFLGLAGVTLDDMIDNAFPQSILDSMVQEMAKEVGKSGKFRVGDGKLYMSDGTSEDPGDSMFERYQLEGETLTLLTPTGNMDQTEDMDAIIASLYPMTFHKVS